MEEFFQYIGPDDGVVSSVTLLTQERMFVYTTPRTDPIDRCGELRIGSYFACSSVLYYDDNIWLKIRRGYFSNAHTNGYIRVYLTFPTGSKAMDGCDLPSRQRVSVVVPQPAQFRHIRRLPHFPTYLCASDRLVLYREPVFTLYSTSVSSSSTSSSRATWPRHMDRFLPPVSVFHATECKFNQDFTQLSIKVASALVGWSGWINASFHKTLMEVEDPDRFGFFHHGPLYMQNVAGRGGKWAGELPVRAIPSLQAPRLYNVESFRVVRAIKRKLLKDRVWIRIQPLKTSKQVQLFEGETKSDDDNCSAVECENDQEEIPTAGPDAWIIERNANTAQRVVVPWGNDRIRDVPVDDDAERFYRTMYSRRPLPLRRTADLEAEIVGHLEPGFVFSSTQRILNDRGRMWIRVALPSVARLRKSIRDDVGENDDTNVKSESNVDESKEEEAEEFEDFGKSVRYGYVIQSNAKTNTCMVQEIPSPGKMNPKQYYQVSLSSDDTQAQNRNSSNGNEVTGSATENTLSAYAEASSSAKELFSVRNGAIVSALGSVYNAKEGRMWLQVLATELKPAMRVTTQQPLSEAEQKLNVVYLPMCDPNRPSPESVLKPIHHELVRIANPLQAEKDGQHSPSRVVFTGRASKLFGSHLLRPSTIGLSSVFTKKHEEPDALSSNITVSDSTAGENNRTQSLKDEITAWQLQTNNRMTQWYTQLGLLAGYSLSCIRRPFASCLAHQEAKRRYQQLDQDAKDMEEFALDDDEVNV